MKPDQIQNFLGVALSSKGFVRYRSAWYWKHPENIWVVSMRQQFKGMRVFVDVAVAASQPGEGEEWPSITSCEMQTSFEWLSEEVPDNVTAHREYKRGAYYGIVLDGSDTSMSDKERVAALAGASVQLACIANRVDSLVKLKAFLNRPDVRKPLMKKEFRRLLEEAM